MGAPAEDEDEDVTLLRAVAGGDSDALQSLYRRHSPWLTVRLTRRCNDADLVSDCLQDTFVAVWKGAGRFRGDGQVAGWLWGIAVRRLVSRLRSRPKLTRPFDTPHLELLASRRTVFDMEEQLLGAVEYGDVGGALARLSPEMRAVVQATVLDGLTVREAAHLLGVPQGTVKTRLHRAKAQLRLHLREGTV